MSASSGSSSSSKSSNGDKAVSLSAYRNSTQILSDMARELPAAVDSRHIQHAREQIWAVIEDLDKLEEFVNEEEKKNDSKEDPSSGGGEAGSGKKRPRRENNEDDDSGDDRPKRPKEFNNSSWGGAYEGFQVAPLHDMGVKGNLASGNSIITSPIYLYKPVDENDWRQHFTGKHDVRRLAFSTDVSDLYTKPRDTGHHLHVMRKEVLKSPYGFGYINKNGDEMAGVMYRRTADLLPEAWYRYYDKEAYCCDPTLHEASFNRDSDSYDPNHLHHHR